MRDDFLKVLPSRFYCGLRRLEYRMRRPSSYKHFQNLRSAISADGYTYKSFEEMNAVFVHVPKCAGVSINKILFGNLAGGHATLDEYSIIFDYQFLANAFKFTIVRNPWDRLVSAYFFLKQGGFGERDKSWFDQELSRFSDFESFVVNWVNKENVWKWHHFRPQHHYILDSKSRIQLDFIGFLENIESDFDYIAKRLRLNVHLPKNNKSDHESYLDYYSDLTRSIVGSVYAKDIELLGYNFDGSSLSRQLANRRVSA